MLAQSGTGSAVVVRVLDEPAPTWGGVILNAVGLSGVMALVAVLVGLLAGAAFIAWRIRQRGRREEAESDHVRLDLGP